MSFTVAAKRFRPSCQLFSSVKAGMPIFHQEFQTPAGVGKQRAGRPGGILSFVVGHCFNGSSNAYDRFLSLPKFCEELRRGF